MLIFFIIVISNYINGLRHLLIHLHCPNLPLLKKKVSSLPESSADTATDYDNFSVSSVLQTALLKNFSYKDQKKIYPKSKCCLIIFPRDLV